MAWGRCDIGRASVGGDCLRIEFGRIAYADDHFRTLDSAGALVWDDRGRVWIKHGAPNAAITVRGVPRYEIWRYNRERETAILYFRSAGRRTMMLIPSLEGAPLAVRRAACRVDRDSCGGPRHDIPTAGRFSAVPDSTGTIHQVGVSLGDPPGAIGRGAATDTFAVRVSDLPEHLLHPWRVVSNGVSWTEPGSERHHLAGVVQVPAKDVAPPRARRVRFHVRLITADSDNVRRQRDTMVVFTRRTVADSMIGGVVAFVLPDHAVFAAIVIMNGRRRGGIWDASGELWPQPPMASTVLVGGGPSERTLQQGATRLSFNPGHVFTIGDTAHIFFQLMPTPEIATLRARLVVGVGESLKRDARVRDDTIAVALPDSGVSEYRRDVPLAGLPAGRYTIGMWFVETFRDSSAVTTWGSAFHFTLTVR